MSRTEITSKSASHRAAARTHQSFTRHRSFAASLVIKGLVGVSLVAACAIAPQIATADSYLKPVGWTGGSSFEVRCAPGEVLLGVAFRGNTAMRGVAPICGKPVGPTDIEPESISVHPQWHGYVTAKSGTLTCPTTKPAVRGISVATDSKLRLVDGLGLYCEPIPEGASRTFERGATDVYWDAEDRNAIWSEFSSAWDIGCEGGSVAVGLVGRAGASIDALGLICDGVDLPKAYSAGVSEHVGDTNAGAAAAGRPAVEYSPVIPANARPMMGPMDACKSGFVWREASSEDHVCVVPQSRDRAQVENQLAPTRRDPAAGYGPMGCKAGFVWREAFANDLVCVEPEIRDLVRQENSLAASRMQ